MRPVSTMSIAFDLPIVRGQPLRAARAGDDAKVDLRLSELGGIGGDDQVAHHRELAAAAEREPGDRRDDRLPHAQDRFPALAMKSSEQRRG